VVWFLRDRLLFYLKALGRSELLAGLEGHLQTGKRQSSAGTVHTEFGTGTNLVSLRFDMEPKEGRTNVASAPS
jgi:hypothetical protein